MSQFYCTFFLVFFHPAVSQGLAREVYKVCRGDRQRWPGARDSSQPNGRWAHRLRPLGGSHYRWMEGWGERGLGWPTGVNGDSLTDARSLTPTSQVLLWLSRGAVILDVSSIDEEVGQFIVHARHILLFLKLMIQMDTAIILDYKKTSAPLYTSVLLFVFNVGFGSDWWQASKATRSPGKTGKRRQHQHPEETSTLFWTRHTAASHAGILPHTTIRMTCPGCSLYLCVRCATCRRVQPSWGQCMLARRPKPSHAASTRSCSPGRSSWLPVRSAVYK